MKLSARLILGIRHPFAGRRFLYLKLLRRFGYNRPLKVPLRDANSHLYVDPNDNGISKDLFVWRYREEHATAMFKKVLKPGQTVIDIGANIGYYAMIEAECVGPSGRVIAIEPSPANVELLRKNVSSNGFDDIVDVEHGAIGEITGTATLHLSDNSNLHTFARTPMMDSYTKFTDTIEVPMYALDDYLVKCGVPLDSVDVIRMDVEGFEVQAFKGMEKMIQSVKTLIVFVELHPNLIRESSGPEVYPAFIDQLSKFGFQVTGVALSKTSRKDIAVAIHSMQELTHIEQAVEVILEKTA